MGLLVQIEHVGIILDLCLIKEQGDGRTISSDLFVITRVTR